MSPADHDPSEQPENDAVREARHAKEAARRRKESGSLSTLDIATAAGIGIGSAALAAALIYASRGRRKDDAEG